MTAVSGGGPRTTSTAQALVRAARPRQWVKNMLVAAAPGAAGVLLDLGVIGATALAFLLFTAASAGTYLLNDVRDREADAAHPVKRHRPVASGALAVPVAGTAAGALLVGAVVGAWLVEPALALVIGSYVAMTSAYSAGLKRVPLVELAIVAAGFVLRAVAGAVAVGVDLSQWFLIVVTAGAFHLVATKRFAERRDQSSAARRRVVDEYTVDTLAEIRFATAAVALTAYLLWAFEASGSSVWFQLSAAPFALALFRYGAATHEGAGESPEEVLLRDRHLRAYGAVWVVLFTVGVYAVPA